MSKEKQILQLHADGRSGRWIASSLSVSRNTVSSVVSAAIRTGFTVPVLQMSDQELFKVLFPEKATIPVQVVPNYEQIHKDLLKDGVTLSALWEDYCDSCRAAKQPPYMYSQFCKLCSDYVNRNKLTMHIYHKPGNKLMVDWAGTKFSYYDSDEGCERVCFLFVATLPFSMYCYAEAFTDMKQAAWINAHVHMYAYLGGSTRLLVCLLWVALCSGPPALNIGTSGSISSEWVAPPPRNNHVAHKSVKSGFMCHAALPLSVFVAHKLVKT